MKKVLNWKNLIFHISYLHLKRFQILFFYITLSIFSLHAIVLFSFFVGGGCFNQLDLLKEISTDTDTTLWSMTGLFTYNLSIFCMNYASL